MATAIRNTRLILEKEEAEYVWKLEAILQPINCTINERSFGISYDLKSPPATIDVQPIPQSAKLALTKHRGFQAVQHQTCTTSPPLSAPEETNLAPAIFAVLMIAVAVFHGWGVTQYYRGSVDNRVECRR